MTEGGKTYKLNFTEAKVIDALRAEADPIVADAQEISAQAIIALGNGNGYNSDEVPFEDYYPNGLVDAVRCLLEPFKRTYVTGRMAQARDLVGYSGLFVAWLRAGRPVSKFKPLMAQFYAGFYRTLKDGDTETGQNLGTPEWENEQAEKQTKASVG